ncbi:efflux pump, RND family, membrane fusion protein [Citrifermentans bemidjiense Bem]|uniref:Efflux pump, RND family, membrane fusion protein n=1 Tax=Citrifermentans bemidjiense (strain ATCC BAA-1014 / DSM 16622 / JCM 12645 / Bem) TaxID=404380 RepID=B5EIQ0_CITBB|nr:efflux RND transporter periplasmic adaptor subunit [Citrifermentans bemidjiense]ACH38415.1 efflux pump, RND family, membrane fusion protein [Citrifermentans bemidjiense Bem]
MSRRYLLPILAAVGLAIGVVAVIRENRTSQPARPAVQPAAGPFTSFVAGAGIIEPSSGNVAVGTPVPGIVKRVFVKWGDWVRAGEPLLQIDDRDLRARLPSALARKKEAAARFEQARVQLRIADSVPDRRAISLEELETRRAAVAIASAALEGAQAEIEQLKAETSRRTIRAPEQGRILRVEVRPGEFAPSGAPSTPLLELGDDRQFHVRVDVDEHDAWRVRAGAAAVASVPGNPNLRTSLHFMRIEPSLVRKTSLTGSSTERVDTRVLQVIYRFDPERLPEVYIGQQMDVWIQVAPESAGSRAPRVGKP